MNVINCTSATLPVCSSPCGCNTAELNDYGVQKPQILDQIGQAAYSFCSDEMKGLMFHSSHLIPVTIESEAEE